jgi:FtsH-binding integral membrane protein
MNYAANPYQTPGYSVAEAGADERASFITKTYLHLAGAIGLFVILTSAMFTLPITQDLIQLMVGSQYGWLIVLGLFMGTSWIANTWAQSSTSIGLQYAGLGLYVFAQSIIMCPLIYFASRMDPTGQILVTAGGITLGLFALLTGVVFITRKDFSFLRSALMYGGFAAMGLIVCGIIFGFSLGSWFTAAMIAFACCYILYDTSNVLHHYRVGQHVAASLALFASVALLFWYILRLVMELQRD